MLINRGKDTLHSATTRLLEKIISSMIRNSLRGETRIKFQWQLEKQTKDKVLTVRTEQYFSYTNTDMFKTPESRHYSNIYLLKNVTIMNLNVNIHYNTCRWQKREVIRRFCWQVPNGVISGESKAACNTLTDVIGSKLLKFARLDLLKLIYKYNI